MSAFVPPKVILLLALIAGAGLAALMG